MKLHCPECGAEIAAGDINLQTSTAKCSSCNAVFSFAGALASEGHARRPVTTSIDVGRPPRMRVNDFGGTWSIQWRWFNSVIFILTLFCIAWDSFLVFWYHMAFTSKNVPWLMVVFPVAHVGVGVGLTYTVLCGYFNRTVVSIQGGVLSIRHGPLPWLGNRDVDARQIDHLVIGWSRTRNTNSNGGPTGKLSAVMKTGESIRLVGGFTDSDEPAFLQQQLELKLKLPPAPLVAPL